MVSIYLAIYLSIYIYIIYIYTHIIPLKRIGFWPTGKDPDASGTLKTRTSDSRKRPPKGSLRWIQSLAGGPAATATGIYGDGDGGQAGPHRPWHHLRQVFSPSDEGRHPTCVWTKGLCSQDLLQVPVDHPHERHGRSHAQSEVEHYQNIWPHLPFSGEAERKAEQIENPQQRRSLLGGSGDLVSR